MAIKSEWKKVRDLPKGAVFSRCEDGYKYMKTNRCEYTGSEDMPYAICLENGNYYPWEPNDRVIHWLRYRTDSLIDHHPKPEPEQPVPERFWIAIPQRMITRRRYPSWNEAHAGARDSAHITKEQPVVILEATHIVTAHRQKEPWITTEQTRATKR